MKRDTFLSVIVLARLHGALGPPLLPEGGRVSPYLNSSLSVCLSVYLSIYLYLSICLHIHLSACSFTCIFLDDVASCPLSLSLLEVGGEAALGVFQPCPQPEGGRVSPCLAPYLSTYLSICLVIRRFLRSFNSVLVRIYSYLSVCLSHSQAIDLSIKRLLIV